MPKLYSAIAASLLCLLKTFTLCAQCNPPAAPFGKTLVGTGTAAAVNWLPVPGAVSYDYYLSLYPSAPPSTSTTTANTQVQFQGLTPNTTYQFCVRTVCSTGNSFWECDTFTTILAPPPCPEPTNLTVNATGPHNIITGWTPVSGAINYEYFLSTSSTPAPTGNMTPYQGIALSGLKSMATYYFCVRTWCSSTEASFWVCDTVYTPVALTVEDTKNANSLRFYPNPVSNILHIDMVDAGNEILLTNVYGSVIYSRPATMRGKQEIDMTGYPVGLYLLTHRTATGTHSYKIQKQ